LRYPVPGTQFHGSRRLMWWCLIKCSLKKRRLKRYGIVFIPKKH
jgi:hypothetical protein